jgi:hypothetical protein
MPTKYILSEYVDQAMAQAEYDKLEDGTFSGRIPACQGVVAFGATLRQCQDELRSTLEDWIFVGLKLGHALPVIAGIDLNKEPTRESVDPCRRREFIRRLRRLGFDGPFAGTRHQFMLYQARRLAIPSNAEYSVPQLRVMIREVEEILGREITLVEWNRL